MVKVVEFKTFQLLLDHLKLDFCMGHTVRVKLLTSNGQSDKACGLFPKVKVLLVKNKVRD